MDLYRTSNVLIRYATSSLVPRDAARRCLCTSGNAHMQPRNFSTTSRQRQLPNNISANSSAPLDDRNSGKVLTDRMSGILSDHVRSGAFNASPPTTPQRERRPTLGSRSARRAVDDILDRVKDPKRQARPVDETSAPTKDVLNLGASMGAPALKPEEKPFTRKLGPTLGRTVRVDNARGRDIARALKMLDRTVKHDSIRKDEIRQRFHERPGMRRKRIKAERWRSRFREGFRDVIARVRAMTKQGW